LSPAHAANQTCPVTPQPTTRTAGRLPPLTRARRHGTRCASCHKRMNATQPCHGGGWAPEAELQPGAEALAKWGRGNVPRRETSAAPTQPVRRRCRWETRLAAFKRHEPERWSAAPVAARRHASRAEFASSAANAKRSPTLREKASANAAQRIAFLILRAKNDPPSAVAATLAAAMSAVSRESEPVQRSGYHALEETLWRCRMQNCPNA